MTNNFLSHGSVIEWLRRDGAFATILNSQSTHTTIEMTAIDPHQFGGP